MPGAVLVDPCMHFHVIFTIHTNTSIGMPVLERHEEIKMKRGDSSHPRLGINVSVWEELGGGEGSMCVLAESKTFFLL